MKTAKHLPNPKRATRADAMRARTVRTQQEYEALMLQASAIIHDALQGPGPRRLDRDPETGRIVCRDIRLQEALRCIDEVSPPEVH